MGFKSKYKCTKKDPRLQQGNNDVKECERTKQYVSQDRQGNENKPGEWTQAISCFSTFTLY